MNNKSHRILLLYFLLCKSVYLSAQITMDFTIKVTTTPSTCQANGTATIELEKDPLLIITNTDYEVTTANGFSKFQSNNNVFQNLSADNYTIKVKALCKINDDYETIEKSADFVIDGDYITTVVSFNATKSRKSYDQCNTGIIALNVTYGSGNFTFDLVSAPAGVQTGTVIPARDGSVYTFPEENYPPGDYELLVDDGCYTAALAFTIGQITGFPEVSVLAKTNFYHPNIENSCSMVHWGISEVHSSYVDYYRYFLDGMYEVGLAPVNSELTSWTVWSRDNLVNGKLLLDISPYSYSDFFTNNSLWIVIRIKGNTDCSVKHITRFYRPTFSVFIQDSDCEGPNYVLKANTSNYGLFCYPVDIKITNRDNGTIVYEDPNFTFETQQNLKLEYNVNYNIRCVDQKGISSSSNFSYTLPKMNTYRTFYCDNYRLGYITSHPELDCFPCHITIKDEEGTIVHTDIVEDGKTKYCFLDYDKKYTLEANFINFNPPHLIQQEIFYESPIPTDYTVYYSYSSSCSEHRFGLNIYAVGNDKYFPSGTKFTITDSNGNIVRQETGSSGRNHLTQSFPFPPGEYTLTVDHGCGTPVVIPVVSKGGYSSKDFGYTTRQTCGGLQVYPQGTMTLGGEDISTNYRLTNGPTGYDKTMISPGEYFTFSEPGVYELGITNRADCVLHTLEINYEGPRLKLDPTETNAYACKETNEGIILLKATDGVAPYTYELWNEDNTIKIGLPDITTEDRADFEYGQANERYTIRITDQCGNKFNHQITISSLDPVRIVYAPKNEICAHDTIKLRCITLGYTDYNWTGPNGFATTAQNPQILNPQANMTGWYKISVTPEYCGSTVTDSLYIQAYSSLIAKADKTDIETCVRTQPGQINCEVTGGKGEYVCQWQSSPDGIENWNDISGENQNTFSPPSQVKSLVNYYRLTVTDFCGIAHSDTISVTFKPCYIPINPQLRSVPDKKK